MKTKLPTPAAPRQSAKKSKTAHRRPARSKRSGVNLTPFVVKQEWVMIEVQIPASQMEFFNSVSPYFVSKLGQDVAGYVFRPSSYLDSVESGKASHPEEREHFEALREFTKENNDGTGSDFAPLEIQMRLSEWESVCRVARAFDVSSADFVRAALADREVQARAFIKAKARREATR